MFEENHKFENMFPVQKIINHYKGSLDLETFRNWYLGGLHERLKKLPKNPRAEKSRKKKQYLPLNFCLIISLFFLLIYILYLY